MLRPSELEPGQRIDGYVLGERLANGGMGSIWRATRADLKMPLVLKIPFFMPGDDVSNIIGYEVEEMVMRRLEGPHVPRFVGAGDLAALPYLAMEYVAGTPLDNWVRQAPVAPVEVARIGAMIAEALDDVHHQKVVHHDLKPGNIILAERGAVLLDFGLARHEDLPDLLGEESALPMGSAPYMAPEQVLGHRGDPASDIFALGAILYELATKELPFGDPQSTSGMKRRLYKAPKPPRAIVRSIPRWLQEIVLKCLEVDPRRRYASAGQLLFDLNHGEQVTLTERGSRDEPEGLMARLVGWFAAKRRTVDVAGLMPQRIEVSAASRAPIVLAAVDLGPGQAALAEEVRVHVRRVLDSAPEARLACLTVLRTKLAGDDDTVDEAGRTAYVGRLLALKDWAQPLGVPEEAVSYHVVEAIDPGGAILDYAEHNRVDHIVLGARGSSALRRHLGSVSAAVVARAHCTVTVVRLKARAAEGEAADATAGDGAAADMAAAGGGGDRDF